MGKINNFVNILLCYFYSPLSLKKLIESQTSRDNKSCMSYMSKHKYSSKVGCGKKNLYSHLIH